MILHTGWRCGIAVYLGGGGGNGRAIGMNGRLFYCYA